MAYYYSASERAFFSSEIMSVDAMPSDKVAVADQAYKQLMADQVAGKLIRTGSGNSPESVDQGLTAATRFGDVSFGKVTGTNLDINGNGDVSGTFVVGGAVTIKGSLNAQGGLNVTSITATGTSTLAAVNATNLSLSGTLKVNGASTLQAVSAKKITATEIDLNGSMDASGNVVVHGKTTLEALQANGDVNVGGLLKVTGSISTQASVDASASRAFRVIYNDLEAGVSPSSGIQKWPLNIYDKNRKTLATIKYIKEQSGRTQFMLADLRGEESSHFASLIMGHNADGTGYMATYVPASFGSDVDVSGDLSVIGDVDCEVLKGKMLYVRGAGGAHIVRQITDYTKGQAPSNSMYIGHFLYGSGVTNQTSNRVAGNEIAISSSGNVTYTFSCYEPVAGSTKTTTLRLGYGDESWINLDADNVNLASTVNVNGALNVNNNDVSVKGWIRLTGNIESGGTQPFKLTASSLDVKASPASNIQLWPLGVYDKNGLAAAYIKYNKYTDGRQNIQLLSRYVREDDTYDLTGLTVGHHADGTFYTDVPHPVTSSDDNSIATTAWVRALFEAGLGSAIPSGVAFPYAGKTVPSGFMACNGGTISRTTYAKLFAAIGTAWGAGDGSTTFKLPDWRNRTVMGANNANEVGTYLESGAPNITGFITGGGQSYTTQYGGAFYEYGGSTDTADSGHSTVPVVGFDASRSNPIYGAAEIVQPPAGKALWIIKV